MPPFPERTDFDLYAQMTSARAVGGDYCEIVPGDDGNALFFAQLNSDGSDASLNYYDVQKGAQRVLLGSRRWRRTCSRST